MTAPAMDRLRKLSGFRPTGESKWEAKCPAHTDRKASLSIGLGNDGRLLLHCHAGCESDLILKTVGIQKRDLFDGHGPQTDLGAPVATYTYRNLEGEEVYQIRKYIAQGEKTFRAYCSNGKSGIEGLKRVPYNLPAVAKASDIFLVEGEKDCDSLRSIGLVGSTNPFGAGNWTDEMNQYFVGKHVTVIPDNDDAGRKHGQHVAVNLHGKAASVKVLELADLPDKGDVSDWLIGRDPTEAAEELSRLSEAAPEWKPEQKPKIAHGWEQAEDRYRLILPDTGIVMEVDRLRRETHQLIGELCVRCDLPGARTYDGALSIADFNLSSARARTERAKLLADRSNAPDLDWNGIVEELCQRVLAADRAGQPAVDLRDLERPSPDDSIRVEGLVLPRRHPTFVFGDGGAAKSYTGLFLAGRLVEQGFAIGLFDWELAGEDHRDRLERLFGLMMPHIRYARCERPLVYEMDRLRRIVRDEKVDFAIYDSVAFACDGPPESAEVAGRYFRAVRQIGPGSLHIAHISKSEGGDQKPFGSVFWHNGARCSYFVKLSDESRDGDTLSIGLFNRKANLGRLHPPIGFKIAFAGDRTYFTREDPADTPDLAEKMTIRQRMMHVLRHGVLEIEKVAEETGAKPETIRRTVLRHKRTFTVIEGGKVALLQRVS